MFYYTFSLKSKLKRKIPEESPFHILRVSFPTWGKKPVLKPNLKEKKKKNEYVTWDSWGRVGAKRTFTTKDVKIMIKSLIAVRAGMPSLGWHNSTGRSGSRQGPWGKGSCQASQRTHGWGCGQSHSPYLSVTTLLSTLFLGLRERSASPQDFKPPQWKTLGLWRKGGRKRLLFQQQRH